MYPFGLIAVNSHKPYRAASLARSQGAVLNCTKPGFRGIALPLYDVEPGIGGNRKVLFVPREVTGC